METNLAGNCFEFRLGGGGVQSFKFDGRNVAKLAVKTPEVVPIDPLGDGNLEVIDIPPWAPVPDQLSLKQRI